MGQNAPLPRMTKSIPEDLIGQAPPRPIPPGITKIGDPSFKEVSCGVVIAAILILIAIGGVAYFFDPGSQPISPVKAVNDINPPPDPFTVAEPITEAQVSDRIESAIEVTYQFFTEKLRLQNEKIDAINVRLEKLSNRIATLEVKEGNFENIMPPGVKPGDSIPVPPEYQPTGSAEIVTSPVGDMTPAIEKSILINSTLEPPLLTVFGKTTPDGKMSYPPGETTVECYYEPIVEKVDKKWIIKFKVPAEQPDAP